MNTSRASLKPCGLALAEQTAELGFVRTCLPLPVDAFVGDQNLMLYLPNAPWNRFERRFSGPFLQLELYIPTGTL